MSRIWASKACIVVYIGRLTTILSLLMLIKFPFEGVAHMFLVLLGFISSIALTLAACGGLVRVSWAGQFWNGCLRTDSFILPSCCGRCNHPWLLLEAYQIAARLFQIWFASLLIDLLFNCFQSILHLFLLDCVFFDYLSKWLNGISHSSCYSIF